MTPHTTSTRLRLLGLIAFSTLLLVAVACSSSAEPATSTPIQPTAQPTATSGQTPTAVAQPSGVSPELAEFLAEVDRRMAEIRGIPVAEPVPFRFLSEAELNAYVRDQIDDQETVDSIALSDALYKLLGLIPPDSDLYKQYTTLLDSQVLGAYDPEVEEFVVLQRGDSFGPSQEFTYAHEYVHRLQDSLYGLDGITERLEENSDRSIAFSALVEGDATTSQQIYALRHLELAQLSEILADSQGAVNSANGVPYILRRGLEFPYIEGAAFVENIRVSQGVSGLHAAFEQPPDSTEQILHGDKYVNRELPIEVELPDSMFAADGPLGGGWEQVDEDVMGEFFLKTWLEAIGAASVDATEAAAGWGGDALALGENGDGEHAMAAKIVWDDPDLDSQQFFLVLTTIMAASPDFTVAEIGPDIGVRAFEGPGGVIVAATLPGETTGNFTALAAAPTLQVAMPLLLSLAG